MNKSLSDLRDALAKQQGERHACPIIRTMYPLTSRSDMAKQFAQLYSLGFDVGAANVKAKAEEMLVKELDCSMVQSIVNGQRGQKSVVDRINKTIQQWREFVGTNER